MIGLVESRFCCFVCFNKLNGCSGSDEFGDDIGDSDSSEEPNFGDEGTFPSGDADEDLENVGAGMSEGTDSDGEDDSENEDDDGSGNNDDEDGNGDGSDEVNCDEGDHDDKENQDEEDESEDEEDESENEEDEGEDGSEDDEEESESADDDESNITRGVASSNMIESRTSPSRKRRKPVVSNFVQKKSRRR